MQELSATFSGVGVHAQATIDTVLDSILSAEPAPHVVAAAETGLCVPMPSGVPVRSERTITGVASFLELCMPADLDVVVAAWQRALVAGLARVVVHLRREPQNAVNVYFVDARQRYGVYLGIIAGARGTIDGSLEKPALFRPSLWTMDRNAASITLRADPAVEQILGWTSAELVGRTSTELLHPDDRTLSIAVWMEMLGRPGSDRRANMRYRHRDGHYIWFEVTHTNLLEDTAEPRVVSRLLDISERMDAIERLRASEEFLRRLTETLPQGVAHVDTERRILYHNERLLQIVGLGRVATLDDVFAMVNGDERSGVVAAVEVLLRDGGPIDTELSFDRGNIFRRCIVSMRALFAADATVNGAVLSFTDVTEREQLRAEVERRARFDQLTKCYNRAAILDALEGVLQRSPGSDAGNAVLFLDLDRFKAVNDKFGHATGDALLRCVGERLLDVARAGDIVGRLGGDEFLVVCPGVDTPETALRIARRLSTAVAQPATVAERSLLPGSSIGVAWAADAVDADTMIARADAAMYEAKRNGTGCVLAPASSA